MLCLEYRSYEDAVFDSPIRSCFTKFKERDDVNGLENGVSRPVVDPKDSDQGVIRRLAFNEYYYDLNAGSPTADNLIFQGTRLCDLRSMAIDRYTQSGEVDEEAIFYL